MFGTSFLDFQMLFSAKIEAKMDGMAAIYYWGLKQSAEASAASGAPAAG